MHKYSRKYYLKTREKTIEARKAYRRENKDKINIQQREWYKRKKLKRDELKVETLTHYGNGKLACVKCSFSDVRALTLDHIRPVGQQEKRVTGLNFYRWLQKQNYPEGYQTLCANCQLIKMFEGNEWKIN